MIFFIVITNNPTTFAQKTMEKKLLLGRDGEELLRLVENKKFTKVYEHDRCCKCNSKYRVGYHYQNETSETYLCQDCCKKYDPKYMYTKPRVYRNSIGSKRR